MARKILNKNSPGTSGTFAADDWDYINKYLTDVDQTAIDPVTIKTNTSFWDNRLRVWNPAKTKSYRIRGLAIVNDYDLTLPLLSSNDEIVGLLATQTLQNKQINVNNNTIKHGTTNAIGDLLVGTGTKYDRLAMGATGGYVLSIKNDLSGLEWVAAAGGGGGEANTASNVGSAGVGLFKLKSGVDMQFKKLNTASGGLITVVDDTANSEVDLKIAGGTDGQVLKTVGTTPTWTTLPAAAQAADWTVNMFAWHNLTTAEGASGMWDGFITSSGTYSFEFSTGLGQRGRWTTAAADNARAGWITNADFTRGNRNSRVDFRIGVPNIAAQSFIGFVSGTAGTLLDLDSIVDSKNGIGLWITSSSTNVDVKRNDGSGGGTNTAVNPTTTVASGGTHNVSIYSDDGGISWHVIFNGTDNLITTDLPAPSATLGFAIITQVLGGSTAISFDLRRCQFKCDPS